ncbi:MAG: hypothetical protein U0470_07250 [Anaerolineae bacterium]
MRPDTWPDVCAITLIAASCVLAIPRSPAVVSAKSPSPCSVMPWIAFIPVAYADDVVRTTAIATVVPTETPVGTSELGSGDAFIDCRVTQSSGRSLDNVEAVYQYDHMGNLIELATFEKGVASDRQRFEYDGRRLVEIKSDDGEGTKILLVVTLEYKDGRLVRTVESGDVQRLGALHEIQYHYDKRGRLISRAVTNTVTSALVFKETLEYDALDRETRFIADSDGDGQVDDVELLLWDLGFHVRTEYYNCPPARRGIDIHEYDAQGRETRYISDGLGDDIIDQEYRTQYLQTTSGKSVVVKYFLDGVLENTATNTYDHQDRLVDVTMINVHIGTRRVAFSYACGDRMIRAGHD